MCECVCVCVCVSCSVKRHSNDDQGTVAAVALARGTAIGARVMQSYMIHTRSHCPSVATVG